MSIGKLHVSNNFESITKNFVMVDEKFISDIMKKPIKNDDQFHLLSDFTPVHTGDITVYSATVGGIKWRAVHDTKHNDYTFTMRFPKCPVDMTVDEEPVDVYTGLYVEVPVIPQVFANAIAKEIINREAQTKAWVEKGSLVNEGK